MIYRKIEQTDLNISSISLGSWVFGGDMWGGCSEQDCMGAICAARDYGVNLIDTAPIYGNGQAESYIGKAIKGQRNQFILATKCGLIAKGRKIQNNLSPESITLEIEASLKRLKTDYIDIYQCHWPDSNTPIETTMGALKKLRDKGQIRYIGVSNFSKELLSRAMKVSHIVTSQNQYSLLERSFEETLLPFCLEQHVGILTYGALAGGILTGKYQNQPVFNKADARTFFYKFYKDKCFESIQSFLSELQEIDIPNNQLAINWVRQQRGITSVIVGCRNSQQVKENVAALECELSESQQQFIQTLLCDLK